MNDSHQLKRPPHHEKVSEDLIIYALPHWECPSGNAFDECTETGDIDSGIKAWTMFGLLGLLGLVALAVSF